jgi:hypothetical protein
VKVVHEGSARLGLRNERTVGLDTDHQQICKFYDEQDHNYQRVLLRLETVVGAIREQTSPDGELIRSLE